jgi:hypothetical protein
MIGGSQRNEGRRIIRLSLDNALEKTLRVLESRNTGIADPL